MEETRFAKIAGELGISPAQVRATAQLLGEDATVPFIARYRKEMTGALDEVAIAPSGTAFFSSKNWKAAARP